MSRMIICQAFQQLEHDYNCGGILWERPSCQRRSESIGVQLHRIGFDSKTFWVDIDSRDPDEWSTEQTDDNENVREIYYRHVLQWGLPINEPEQVATIERIFTEDYRNQFPNYLASVEQCAGEELEDMRKANREY